ncbi:MAG: DEAD/DEAH box helicase [Methylococcales bacterium]|jgi:hypothetical protein|nr:DEAD/DEAH box helicase [Methylococcales bacterium]
MPDAQSSPEIQQLLTYSPEQQLALQVLSVIHTGVNQTTWKRILAELDWKNDKGISINSVVKRQFTDDLASDQLIDVFHGQFSCHETISGKLSRDLLESHRYQHVVDAIVSVHKQFKPHHRTTIEASAQLRNAIYLSEDNLAAKLLNINPKKPFTVLEQQEDLFYPLNNLNIVPPDDFFNLCHSLDKQTFKNLHPCLTFQVIAPTLLQSTYEFFVVETMWQNATEHFLPYINEDNDLASFMLVQFVVRGQINVATATLSTPKTADDYRNQAWLHALQQKDDSALKNYEIALKLKCKETKKRTASFDGLPGIWYILVLIRSGQALYDTAKKSINHVLSATDTVEFADLFCLLDQLIDVLNSQIQYDAAHWLHQNHFETNPWLNLFRVLATHWLDETPAKHDIESLIKNQALAQQLDYMLYAWEAALLLKSLKQSKHCPLARVRKQAPEFQPITHLISPMPAWEKGLIALQTLTQTEKTHEEKASHGERLIWRVLIDEDGAFLAPKIQKRAKNGNWSKGRPVALERLLHTPEAFDFLTTQDKAISKHIEEHLEYSGWRHPTAHYTLGEQAIIEATGHPLLFSEDNPSQSIELVGCEPVLEVHQLDQELLLTLEPFPNDGLMHILEETRSRFRITPFTEQHLRIAEILSDRGLTVPNSAQKQVLTSLSAIAPLLTIHSDIGAGQHVETVEALITPIIQIRPEGDGIEVHCYVRPFQQGGPLFHPGIGRVTLMAEVAGSPLQTTRDLSSEQTEALQILGNSPHLTPNNQWHWHLNTPDTALETLIYLKTLEDQIIIEWPEGQQIQIMQQPSNGMQLNIAQQQDWFKIEGDLTLENAQVLSMKDLLELIDQAPGRFVKLKTGEFLALTQDFRNKIKAINAASDQGMIHSLAVPIVDEIITDMATKKPKKWQDQITRFEQAQLYQPVLPTTLEADLRPYQLEGFQWLSRLAHWGAGACLADDMGLGKTLQILALLVERAPLGASLVIAPTSVCGNWLSEAQRFAPTLRTHFYGTGDRIQMLKQAKTYDVIIVSYGLLQSNLECFAEKTWVNIVADEAQAFKNAQTKRSKAIMSLQGEFKVIATGTPVENHLGELWNLFQFINPGLLGRIEHFNAHYASDIEQSKDKVAQQRLKQLLRPFILRRLKRDVLPDLPARTEITIPVELSENELTLYEALRQKAVERMAESELPTGQQRVQILTEILRLRQACCHPRLIMPDSKVDSSKLTAFKNICKELLENKHKALVFSQFVKHLSLIREYLDEHNIAYQYLDGSTPAKKRAKIVSDFQTGIGDLFLISLKAGGSGLNLTAADYVIHMDPWWNPAVEDQASDRAHRMGQLRPVTIYRLIAKNTIEDKIVKLHTQKRDLADNLLEGSEMSGKMSVEDMLGLIKGS